MLIVTKGLMPTWPGVKAKKSLQFPPKIQFIVRCYIQFYWSNGRPRPGWMDHTQKGTVWNI